MGLSVAIAWGAGLEAAFMAPVMTMTLLAKPGPPIPLVKGVVLGLVIAALLLAGVLTVPILEHYPVTGVLLTGALFYSVSYTSARKANPLTLFMHVALVFIPVAGVADQAATTVLARTAGVALVIGVLASAISHALFPDAPGPAKVAAAPAGASPEAAGWIALQAWRGRDARVHAGAHQPGHVAAMRHENSRAGTAGRRHERAYGRARAGRIHIGGGSPGDGGLGRPLAPAELVDVRFMDRGRIALDRREALPGQGHTFPSIVLAQRPDDDVLRAGARHRGFRERRRCLPSLLPCVSGLFVLVALYASAMVWVLERWRASRSRSLLPERG